MTGVQLTFGGLAPECIRCGQPIHKHRGAGRPRRHCVDCRPVRTRTHNPCQRPRPEDRVLLDLYGAPSEPIPVVVLGRSWEPAGPSSGHDRIQLVRFRTAEGRDHTCELSFWRSHSRPMENA